MLNLTALQLLQSACMMLKAPRRPHWSEWELSWAPLACRVPPARAGAVEAGNEMQRGEVKKWGSGSRAHFGIESGQ